jgi:hypothetical protein
MVGDLVEQAYREGKFPKERCAHYYALMAKKPKKTAKLLASLEPVLGPPGDQSLLDEFAEEQRQAAPVAAARPAPSGPTSYPKGWLRPGETGVAGVFGGSGTVVKEEGAAVAEAGEVL